MRFLLLTALSPKIEIGRLRRQQPRLNRCSENWDLAASCQKNLLSALLWTVFPPKEGCHWQTIHRLRPTWDWIGRGGTSEEWTRWKCKLRAPELLLCRCPGKIYGRNTEGLFVAIHNLYFSAQSKALIICFLNSTVDSYASCKFFAALGFFLIK